MVTPSRGGGGVVKLLINFATLDIKKYGCHLLMSTEQRKNSESPWGIEPQTFRFHTPMLYHWATETLRPIMNFIYDTYPALC